ncbi:MAG: glycine cleavage system aminomethyltransferase GcvT [Pirellulales bacterium]
MTATLQQTPLHDWHAEHGGRLVDFAGWSMPVHYGSIVAEHNATRSALGLFDVSHMGRLVFTGSGAEAFLNSLVTRRVTDMSPGQVRYALATNDVGGILDDVLVYRLPPESRGDQAASDSGTSYLMVVNASNRAKIICWIEALLCDSSKVELHDATDELAMIAVQGPRAVEVLEPMVKGDISTLKYYHCRRTAIDGHSAIVSRTGYTGEDGFEVMLPSEAATEFWQQVLDAAKSLGAMPCGLGCRDTLRLEAAMPLYGHELSEEITPLQAGLDFAVDLEGRTFPGREALCKMQQMSPQRIRVGLELSGKRVPREHHAILTGGETVGEVTSGTFSPTLNKPIAMGYVDRRHAAVGTELSIDVRGSAEPARVVKLPFYRRETKK